MKTVIACKGVEWGLLYNHHKGDNLDPMELQQRVEDLLANSKVQKKSGIYEYLLAGEKKVLNLWTFDENEKLSMYHRQCGKCAICGLPFDIKDMYGDHIIPWSKSSKTTLDNGQMLCIPCNEARKDH